MSALRSAERSCVDPTRARAQDHRPPHDSQDDVVSLTRTQSRRYDGSTEPERSSFDEVFRTEGARVLKTPVRAPKANAFAERFIRTIRAEVFDLVLVTGRRHLFKVLSVYEVHYNSHRPHRGLNLQAPATIGVFSTPRPIRQIERRELLGGLISEYHGVAA
jgi:transposase InsO family protein